MTGSAPLGLQVPGMGGGGRLCVNKNLTGCGRLKDLQEIFTRRGRLVEQWLLMTRLLLIDRQGKTFLTKPG